MRVPVRELASNAAVLAAVRRPLASTVKVGTAVVEPYEPAVTVVVGRLLLLRTPVTAPVKVRLDVLKELVATTEVTEMLAGS